LRGTFGIDDADATVACSIERVGDHCIPGKYSYCF